MSNCPRCRLVELVTVFPYRCQCGKAHWGEGGQTPPRPKPPRAFGQVLRELAGCGCNLPWRRWDRRGLDWCRDNAGKIAKRLTAEPRPAIPIDRARELVRLALRIAARSAESAASGD